MTIHFGRVSGSLGPVLLAGVVAGAQPLLPEQRLEEGKALYHEGRFNEAILQLTEAKTQLEPLRQVQARKLQLSDAYLHVALSLIAIGERAAAKESLKALLRLAPDARLDPDTFAPKVMAIVDEARAELREEPPNSLAPGGGRRRGSSLPWILIGSGAAGGAALAVSARGDGGTPTSTPSPAFDSPRQVSPADGSVFGHFPRATTLSWTAVTGAARYAIDLEFCQNPRCVDGATVAYTQAFLKNLVETSYSFEFVGAQPGRWRVWAIAADGRETPKTGWWEFRYTR